MKCSVCSKEFGTGTHCQYCGVDRVTGLGNYRGYNVPISTDLDDEEHVPYTEQRGQSVTNQHLVNVGSIVCYACGEVIPNNSKFCPYCSTELFVKCLKCGQTYSSQYPACNQCGTKRDSFKDKNEGESNQKESTCVIENGTTSINPYQYKGKRKFKEIVIPESVTSIGDSAFRGCISLEKIQLPPNLLFLGDRAFCECENLKEIVIPNSIKSIGLWTFSECISLEKVKLPRHP